ncbi:filamentous haemagglutinin family protein [Bradyrhizobium cenepequi]|uniref:filamentous haemagglutinin family protein n=1 Tax=Bradyrhizobium cenepequi TaxID=2821403 RepID=UPI001CE2B2F8|nr:filamentous haemagglutinin family protein [Bradyrhizobium cenepequi]MCA6109660.1 filamentous hemagglutinin family protein [Bradyrhizobium cenepequi]
MFRRPAAIRPHSTTGYARRTALFASVSVAALFMAGPLAVARPLGAPQPTPSAAAAAAAQVAAEAAARAASQAAASLKRATLAIQAQQAAQAAARDAAGAALRAMPSGIPNGLGPGGLQRATGPNAVWIGANNPTEATEGDRTKVNIEQTQRNAILTWETYNVSENTDLRYDQKGHRDWVALNRVLDPNLAPSKILGTIKGDGTVLVINQNGIIFGTGSQINVGSLIASTLEVGPSVAPQGAGGQALPTNMGWRNENFVQNGLLGYDAPSGYGPYKARFSALSGAPANTGTISVAQGASIATNGDSGLVLLTAPHVINAGAISAPAGQVILAATSIGLYLTPSSGAAGDNATPPVGSYEAAADPNIRGLVPAVERGSSVAGYYVWNRSSGLIEADRGNITLVSPSRDFYFPVGGAVYNDGILSSTTSVSRNGSIMIDGADVRLGAGSLLSILPDRGGETIPQDPTTLGNFKSSVIKVGENANNIEMQPTAFLLAPGANVQFGTSELKGAPNLPLNQNILISSGAEINVAGLTDVLVPTDQVQIVIDPAKKNELRDSPLYRDGFLNGATIYLDPRRSGVRDDGVAWIGSPLIDATAYYQLAGVNADRLMTKGGNVTFGPRSGNFQAGAFQSFNTPSVVVREGAVIDMSGGWARYQAGTIRITKLIDQFGRIVDIGDADPNGVYIGIYGGFTRHHASWGITETWTNQLRMNGQYFPEYTEGRDAGTLRGTASALVLDGTLYAQAYAGSRQLTDSQTGTGTSTIDGDQRAVQGSNGELPAGGALIITALAGATITNAVPRVPDGAYDGWTRGQIASDTGIYAPPSPTTGLYIPTERRNTLYLPNSLLSSSGLSQVSLAIGKITVDADTTITLNAGGIFDVLAGRIDINGGIVVPSGKIILESVDININGGLSVAGRWVNEFTAPRDYIQSHAWLDGGTISMTAISGTLKYLDVNGNETTSKDPTVTAQDISGSILVSQHASLNLSGGGRIDRDGAFDLSAKGGNLTLKSDAHYYPTGDRSGFRIISIDDDGVTSVAINPDRINARIVIDPASIKAHGFGGGGTFTLVTPEFSLGDGVATTGTVLPFDFFSTAGFANYDITSYKTELSPSTFTNGYGGYNALLATQTITVGTGQTLALVQSVLPNILSTDQHKALLGLDSGGDVNKVVSPVVPGDAWDQRAVNLRLGGTLELHVEHGGRVTGAAGSSLIVGGLLNEGTIRIAGGKITQELILPRNYASGIQSANDAIGIRSLSDVFSVNADGTIDPNAPSKYRTAGGAPISNQDLAGDFYSIGGVQGRAIYKLGRLDQGQGIVLASGSVTDLSGAVILDPRAVGRGGAITTGKIVGGGTLAALPTQVTGSTLTSPIRMGGTIVANSGALIDLSGTSGAFDIPVRNTLSLRGGYVSTPVWSDGGALLAGAGGTFTGAVIRANGGGAQAQGGTWQVLNPIFTQHDPAAATANVVSADMITRSGFDTFIATGNITSQGDATLTLDRAFVLQSKPWDGMASPVSFAPVISTGGTLVIDAPYIGLQNAVDQANPVTTGTPGPGTVTFRGRQIDIAGSTLFDRSVSHAIFDASGDIRLIGVVPWQTTFQGATDIVPTLKGMISVNGDLSMIAGQIYPTTGSSFAVTSTAADGTIATGRSSGETPAAPYSAGGNLLIQAAHIVQGGVIRVPFGALTLGSNAAYTTTANNVTTKYAPATQSVVLADGSITSVSAGGLSIPYGTTTDTMEWYFAPTGNDALTAPPTKVLSLNGGSITLAAGATIDLSGGGDVYAYEFVPGTGGSRDVLSQFNADQYSANKINEVGYQYPDGRQVYAIVPGLSDAPAAAYDPIYSANYGNLSAAYGVGKRVYLSGGNGLAAGWYTLLPAQYAMLPGGMRVVEQTGAKNVTPGLSVRQADGTVIASGYYGDALSGASQSQMRLFSVQSQDVIRSYSNIELTSGNHFAIAKANSDGTVAPRTGLDAGRLVLNPLSTMTIDATVSTAAATGGRGAQVDISGTKINIVSNLAGAPAGGVIQLTAAGLNKLNAESLLIGGIRKDNADGTTSLTVTSNSILVANDAANPLVAPEILLVVDDGLSGNVASQLTLNDGATLIATGVMSDQRSGAYIIDGRLGTTVINNETSYTSPAQSAIGALIRVANGPQRVVQRLRTPTSPTNPGSPAGLDASLTVGNVNLQGSAIGLDTSHNASVAGGALLRGKEIAFGAGALAFTSGSVSAGTVVITPQLQAILSQGDHLTLRSQSWIGFDNGTYSFGATTFDAATLLSLEGGTVSLQASQLQLSNAGTAGTAAGGYGTLTIVADELTMGSGTIATFGFGGVSITATKGIFSAGTNGVFDVGSANLALVTRYIGDRAVAGVAPKSSTGMALRSTGAVTITNAGITGIDLANISGIPGSSLTIEGNGVSISGTHLRATAGALTVKSSGNLALSNGAVIEAPGYEKTFGDAADPQTVAAPGGTLSLVALGAGGIALGDALLSVGSGAGDGGNLKLSAANGAVDWGTAILSGKGGAGGQGGTFSLDTNGAIDLIGLNDRVVANGFTGGFNLRTRTGDIVLGVGQILKSGSVNLTADGGFVTIGGIIDTSGTNGGDIELYGVNGVTLLGTARLDAHASGYAADDTRQAKAGNITLGTDFLPGRATIQPDGSVSGSTADSGTITIASGAVIDASVSRPGNRLVRIMRNGTVNYAYVQGDEGGIVSLRAPVVTDGGGNNKTVNVEVVSASSIIGARAIDLEGFKRWDLAQVAASGNYTGVTRDAGTNTIALDLRPGLDTANSDGTLTTVAGLNFLGDRGDSTVVQFVQDFSLSGLDTKLGGLAAQSNFHARPGVDLKHDGNITLVSNWNLGAGTVNVDTAKAAEVMKVDPISGQNYVIVGKEAELLANHTTMTYRVGGSPTGAAPLISLRAGGDLHLKGSVTDGFFQFRDQYDATYQSYLNAKASSFVLPLMTVGIFSGGDGSSLVDWTTFVSSFSPYDDFYGQHLNSIDYAFQFIDEMTAQSGGSGGRLVAAIPFSASGNSAAALGTGAGGVGDPLASAVVFPLLSGGRIVGSSDYRLAAGAATTSADPLRIASATAGNLIVDIAQPRSMTVAAASVGGSFSVEVYDASYSLAGSFAAGQAGFEDFLRNQFPGLSDDAAISLPYANSVPTSLQNFVDATLAADPSAHVQIWSNANWGEVTMSVSMFARYLQQNPAGFGNGGASNVTINLLPQTMVRTGTGGIRLAAAGNVDLTGGGVTYITKEGTATSVPSTNVLSGIATQLGGAAIYTAGRPAESISEILSDPVTGARVSVSAQASTSSIFSDPPDYRYGVNTGSANRGAVSIVIADTLRLVGGGDVEVTAGADVLGRRDLSLGNLRSFAVSSMPWVGSISVPGSTLTVLSNDQPWRINSVKQDATFASINPQLFRSGVGALGGGNVLIEAGGTVSDITAVSGTSLVTATAFVTPKDAPAGTDPTPTKMLLTLGGGDVAIRAGADIFAARIDVASGMAQLSAGGHIGSLPLLMGFSTFQYRDPNNSLRTVSVPTLADSETQIRINDASVNLAAGGDITIQGIRQLDGFYSDRSALNLVANGSITITNTAPMSPKIIGDLRMGSYAIYPGTLTVASLMGDANLRTYAAPPGYQTANPALAEYNLDAPTAILMVPNPQGQLSILAGGNIAPAKIAMLDGDPNLLPGLFTLGGNIITDARPSGTVGGGPNYQFAFPAVFSTTREGELEKQHTAAGTHAKDPTPIYIYADGDIGTAVSGVTLFLPKQARIGAGRDIVNMMFFGQNLAANDLTRIVARRDLVGTTRLVPTTRLGPTQPVLLGNSFILGGPGDLMVESGRNMGPFLNSAVIKNWNLDDNGLTISANGAPLRFGQGILTVGNDWNPYLPEQGANITVLFGVGKGANYDALRDAYVAPGTAANTLGGYGTKLIVWMQKNAADVLNAQFGTSDVNEQQAYQAFLSLPFLRQRLFLINDVYFNELRAPAVKDGPSYLEYSRGYTAVNTLFPASLGYTANSLEGGANDSSIAHTGDLDLRLAAIETMNGGNINILGPGGRVLAGSVVSTAQQAARRNYAGYGLYRPQQPNGGDIAPIEAIPTGYEGVISLRGGTINTFTDDDFLLNQSRLFTVKGGDITMWSSNADLNAGQGAKTTPNFPPAVVRIGKNAFAELDQAGATSGAGIAALPPGVGVKAPDVYLLAPRGAVDAGDAGVRSAGNLSVAALRVVNADNFKVGGITAGIPTVQAPNIGGLTEASNTAGASAKQAATPTQGSGDSQPSIIIVEFLGFGGGDGDGRAPNDDERERQRRSDGQNQDPRNRVQVLDAGELTPTQWREMVEERRHLVEH